MARLAAVSARQVLRVARRLGYQVREGAKHTIVHDGRRVVTAVPRTGGALKRGLVLGILSDLGVTPEEFRKLL